VVRTGGDDRVCLAEHEDEWSMGLPDPDGSVGCRASYGTVLAEANRHL
jgi:hypothetical protein